MSEQPDADRVDPDRAADVAIASAVPPLTTTERRDLIGLGVLAGCWALLPALLGFWLLAEIGRVSDQYQAIRDTHGLPAAIAAYAVLFGVTAGLGLLPTYAQAFLGGWIFGSIAGTGGAMAGILIGTMLGELVSRLVSGRRVEGIIERRPAVAAVRDALVDAGLLRSTGIIALLRLSPNSPFALSNLVLGGSRAGVAPMFLGTLVGMLPRTALAAMLAAAANTDGARGLGDVVRERGPVVTIVGIAVLVVAFVIIARVGRMALQRVVPDAVSSASS
jgi:uncharacterized membrane protein YdjX (TVP38/TMEM64 family)